LQRFLEGQGYHPALASEHVSAWGKNTTITPGQLEDREVWSTWTCPRQVRGWPRLKGHSMLRGVEAFKTVKRPRPLPRT
jgi:hypothetical protein